MLLRAVLVWMLIAMTEVIHGVMRVRCINPRVGDHRARQIAVGTGSVLILLISGLTVPWIAPDSRADALTVGALWLAAMLAFETSLGRFVFRTPWDKIAADFDVRRGGLLGFGMIVLFFAPLLIGRLHGLF